MTFKACVALLDRFEAASLEYRKTLSAGSALHPKGRAAMAMEHAWQMREEARELAAWAIETYTGPR